MNNIFRPQDFNKDNKQRQIDFLREKIEAMNIILINLSRSFSALCRYTGATTLDLQKAYEDLLKEEAAKKESLEKLMKAAESGKE